MPSPPTPPTAYPDWGTAIDPGDIATPSGGQIASGWRKTGSPAVPQKPPYQTMNFLQVLTGQWVRYFKAMTDYLAGNQTIPVGTLAQYAVNSAPTGWLLCDGSTVGRVAYAALFGVIGTTYGAGDGVNTFGLPDARAKVLAGYKAADANFGTFGASVGEAEHTLITAEMPAHDHSLPGSTATSGSGVGSGSNYALVGGNTGSAGSGDPHNNVQPSLTVSVIIKY